MLPACIQVCPIELPGRGRRRGEAGIADVAVLADALADLLPLQVPLLCMLSPPFDLKRFLKRFSRRPPPHRAAGSRLLP